MVASNSSFVLLGLRLDWVQACRICGFRPVELMSDWHDCGHAGGSRPGPVVLIPGRQVVLDFSHVVGTGTMLQTVVQVCKIGIVLARIGLGCLDRGRLQTIRTDIKLAGLFRLAGLYRIRLGMVMLERGWCWTGAKLVGLTDAGL